MRGPAAAVDIRFVGHATVRLEIGGVRVLTDPFLRARLGPLERHGPVPDAADLGPVDVILISHGHADHFDRASLAAVPGRPTIIVPRGLGAATRRAVAGTVIEVAAGDQVDLGSLSLTAVPARHWISPGAARAQPLGYLLDGGPRVYFAGDTGRMPTMRELAGSVDVALLPVWTWGPHLGPGHLGPRSAADAVADIQPAVAIPIHWGTLYPRRLHHVWSRPLTEPGDRFAEHAAARAPDVDVRVLRPGESTRIASPAR
jgi:L-ascorbate metabolism protein UlaG (beta-lactamase superfamily)